MFCRDTGAKEDEEDVDARDGRKASCNIVVVVISSDASTMLFATVVEVLYPLRIVGQRMAIPKTFSLPKMGCCPDLDLGLVIEFGV